MTLSEIFLYSRTGAIPAISYFDDIKIITNFNENSKSMKRTKEEADLLIKEAKQYVGRVWKTLGKEYIFISTGTSFSATERMENEITSKPNNYQIIGIKLETKDGQKLHKTLEQIIEYFKNNP